MLIAHVVMADRVRMVSAATHVAAHQDITLILLQTSHGVSNIGASFIGFFFCRVNLVSIGVKFSLILLICVHHAVKILNM